MAWSVITGQEKALVAVFALFVPHWQMMTILALAAFGILAAILVPIGARRIYQALDRAGLASALRERLVGGTAVKFVERFWPDFTTRIPKKPRA